MLNYQRVLLMTTVLRATSEVENDCGMLMFPDEKLTFSHENHRKPTGGRREVHPHFNPWSFPIFRSKEVPVSSHHLPNWPAPLAPGVFLQGLIRSHSGALDHRQLHRLLAMKSVKNMRPIEQWQPQVIDRKVFGNWKYLEIWGKLSYKLYIYHTGNTFRIVSASFWVWIKNRGPVDSVSCWYLASPERKATRGRLIRKKCLNVFPGW